jgi:integrase/recombinase XerC
VDDAMQLAEFSAAPEVTDPWLECRDAAMVELLYGCGLRVGELVGLDAQASNSAKGWLDLEGAEAHVLGKGSKRRSVPIGSKALAAVRAWLAVRDQGLKFFQKEGAATKGAAIKGTAIKGTAKKGAFLDDASIDKKVSSEVQSALFIGRHGTRLTAQAVWQRLKQRSLKAGLSTPVHPHMLRHSFASHVLQSSSDLRAVQELLGHANISTTQVYTRLDFQHLAKAYDAAHPRARKK